MSHVYLSLAVLPTSKFKQDSTKSYLQSHADHVTSCWNDFVKDSNGDYELHDSIHWDKPVGVKNTSGDACDALKGVRENASDNYSNTMETYDCILVADIRTYSPDAGCAYHRTAGDNDSDGDGQFYNLAFVGETDSSGLSTQEVGHVFSASHSDHKIWGASEYTAMGNDGDPNCSGGTTPSWRYRRNSYSDCTVSNKIRPYCDDNSDIL